VDLAAFFTSRWLMTGVSAQPTAQVTPGHPHPGSAASTWFRADCWLPSGKPANP
jgi:hypothetical protein